MPGVPMPVITRDITVDFMVIITIRMPIQVTVIMYRNPQPPQQLEFTF